MHGRRASVVVAVSCAVAASGCFTGRLQTKAPRAGAEKSTRQWYSVLGLVPLSNPVGAECEFGVTKVDSAFSVSDIAIAIGVALGGALTTYSLGCADVFSVQSCIVGGLALGPLLAGSRTTSYVCAAEPRAGGPPGPGNPGYYPPPPGATTPGATPPGLLPPPGPGAYPPPPPDATAPGGTYPPPPP